MNQAALLGLFYNPVKSFRSIIEYNLTGYKYGLIAFAGLAAAILRSLNRQGIPSDRGSFIMLIISIAAGIFSAFVIISYLSWLLSFTGKWLKGTAHRIQIENVTAFCYAIIILASFISVLHIVAFNSFSENFSTETLSTIGYTIYLILSMVKTLLILYFFILMTIAVSTVQRFSLIRGALNLFLAGLFSTVPFILIGIIFFLLKEATQ